MFLEGRTWNNAPQPAMAGSWKESCSSMLYRDGDTQEKTTRRCRAAEVPTDQHWLREKHSREKHPDRSASPSRLHPPRANLICSTETQCHPGLPTFPGVSGWGLYHRAYMRGRKGGKEEERCFFVCFFFKLWSLCNWIKGSKFWNRKDSSQTAKLLLRTSILQLNE